MSAGIKGVTTTGTILDQIVARKVEEVAEFRRTHPEAGRLDQPRDGRDFIGALQRDTVALIAEVKHASPSKGVLIENFDPVALGATYARNGAAAISVLTDRDFFQGSLDDLIAVRKAVDVPVLRKDFIIDEFQLFEAKMAHVDAVLLIVAILDDALMRALFDVARQLKMAPLVEVHTEVEMERALKLNPPLIGINNRDLHTFKVDTAVTQRLARLAPPEVTLVSESGIFTPADVAAMAKAGARAVLVGESIVKSGDIAGQVRALSGVGRHTDNGV